MFPFIQFGRMRSIVRVVTQRARARSWSQAHSPAKFLFEGTVKWCTIYASFFATHIYCSRNHWSKTTYIEIFWLEIYLKYPISIPPELEYVKSVSLKNSWIVQVHVTYCVRKVLWTPLGSPRLRQILRAHAIEYSYKRLEYSGIFSLWRTKFFLKSESPVLFLSFTSFSSSLIISVIKIFSWVDHVNWPP